MRKYFPIILSLVLVFIAGAIVFMQKNEKIDKDILKVEITNIKKSHRCGRTGKFFAQKGIIQPVTIDLSQKRYKGIVLYYGRGGEKAYHPKAWERFEHFSTYTVDKEGNLFLVPMPYISIRPSTFNLLSNLYKIDTNTGELSIFMHFDDIKASPNNPYGLNAIAYDCEDDTIWVSAIDESTYDVQKGVIYHIDPKQKKILQRFEGYDALSLAVAKADKGKYLFFGSARDSGLYSIKIENTHLVGNPQKLFSIENPEEHIRKIKIKANNKLEIQTIPFTYALIAESSKKDRIVYNVEYRHEKWHIDKQ
jgi:hypothetical protein